MADTKDLKEVAEAAAPAVKKGAGKASGKPKSEKAEGKAESLQNRRNPLRRSTRSRVSA